MLRGLYIRAKFRGLDVLFQIIEYLQHIDPVGLIWIKNKQLTITYQNYISNLLWLFGGLDKQFNLAKRITRVCSIQYVSFLQLFARRLVQESQWLLMWKSNLHKTTKAFSFGIFCSGTSYSPRYNIIKKYVIRWCEIFT